MLPRYRYSILAPRLFGHHMIAATLPIRLATAAPAAMFQFSRHAPMALRTRPMTHNSGHSVSPPRRPPRYSPLLPCRASYLARRPLIAILAWPLFSLRLIEYAPIFARRFPRARHADRSSSVASPARHGVRQYYYAESPPFMMRAAPSGRRGVGQRGISRRHAFSWPPLLAAAPVAKLAIFFFRHDFRAPDSRNMLFALRAAPASGARERRAPITRDERLQHTA